MSESSETRAAPEPSLEAERAEAALWERSRLQRDEAARGALIERHLPLVRFVLGRMPVNPPAHLSEEDLAAAGVIGLIKAVDEFDPLRETKFSTFAVPRIRGAILDELRAHDWVSRTARKKAAALEEAYSSLRSKSTIYPSVDELARAMGVSAEEAYRRTTESRPATFTSLDSLQAADRQGGRERVIESLEEAGHQRPDASAVEAEEEELAAAAIVELPYQERVVVTLYYFKNMMLKEIAGILGVSKPRVSQILDKAVRRLREHVESAHRIHSRPRIGDTTKAEPQPRKPLQLDQIFEQARRIAEGER